MTESVDPEARLENSRTDESDLPPGSVRETTGGLVFYRRLSRFGLYTLILLTGVGVPAAVLVEIYSTRPTVIVQIIGLAVSLAIVGVLVLVAAETRNRLADSVTETVALSQKMESARHELSRLASVDRVNIDLRSELQASRDREEERARTNESLREDIARLTARADSLETELRSVTSEKEALGIKVIASEQQALAYSSEIAKLTQALNDEKLSTQRAPFIPFLDVSLSVVGFGILSPKSVVLDVENRGPGNAVSVEVSAAPNEAGVGRQALIPRGFWPSMVRGDTRRVRVGDLSEFQPSNSVRVLVRYESQFGPRPPIEMSFELR